MPAARFLEPALISDLIAHLDELRKRLIICLISFGAAWVACYFYSRPLVDAFIAPLRRYDNAQLVFQTPYEAFLTHLNVSGLVGFFVSSPVFFVQLWSFLTPGLYANEKKIILPLALFSVILFAVGFSFAYFFVVPAGLHFFLGFQTESLRPLLSIGPYFSFLFWMTMTCGFMFDLPLVLLGLIRLGVLPAKFFIGSRRVIILGVFVVAAIMTPTPDPVTQLFVAVPMWLLFEACFLAARWIAPKKQSQTPKNP